jgi:hypothetical protein
MAAGTHPVNAPSSRQMSGGNGLLMAQTEHRRATMLWCWWTVGNVVSRRTTKSTASETKVTAIVQSRLLLVGRVSVQELNALHDVVRGLTTQYR